MPPMLYQRGPVMVSDALWREHNCERFHTNLFQVNCLGEINH